MFKKVIYFSVAAIVLIFIEKCEPYKDDANDKQAMFRGNVTHNGFYNSPSINKQPVIKWKFKTDGAITSSGTIEGENIFFGSDDGKLYSIDINGGKQNWEFKTSGAINSSPAMNGKTVYFGSYDGFFYALDVNDGSLKWSFKTDGEKKFSAPGIHGRQPKDSIFQDDWDFFLSSPAIEGNIIYFGTGSGYFYALDKITGKEIWKFKTNGVIHASPAIAFGIVYIGSWDTYMYALNAKTGAEVWKFKTGVDTAIYNQTGMQGSPVIDDSTLYFGCRDSHLYSLNALTGKLNWSKFNDYAWVSSCPVISNDKIIYTTGDTRSLVALNKYNGDSIYVFNSKGWIMSSPSIADDKIYYGDLNGFVYSNDMNTGRLIWTVQTDGSKADSYKILNKDSTLNFTVFSKEKKQKEDKTSMQMLYNLGSVHSSPVIKNKTIYFGSTDGYFYAMQ